MHRMTVSSSNILEVGYEEDSQTLEVLFRNDRVYQYFSVPRQVAEELMSAESLGQYLNQHIKGVYRYARV